MSTATTHIKIEKQLVPALRFNGYEEEWNKKKLKSFENKERKVLKAGPFGSAIKKEDYVPQGYKVYGQEQVIKGDPYYGSYFVDEKKFNQLKSCNVVPGDLLISLVGTFGKVLLIPDDAQKGIINPRLLRISISNNEVISNYLKHFFLTPLAIKSLIARSQGGTMGVLNGEIVGSIHVPYPTLPEQQKIASFLSALDEKIQQLSKKKTLLEQYKKGVMQQLFSGQLRFKDENGNAYPDWEEKRLGDVIEFANGKGHEQSIDENGDFVVVNSKFISTSGRVKKYCNSQISPLLKGDIVMVMSDVPNGKALAKCFQIDKDNFYTLNQRICRLQEKTCVNDFLIYVINRNRYYLRFDSGVGQTNLKKDQVLNCPLFIPSSVEEQQKIATYLSSIDTKIEAVNNQITQTQTFKKGLLQQMFV